ncbi:MAG TPA: hypothetical protein VLY24_24850 [Bryobacteraceae bacterium]|nr:hypothetical protein [Bryobacteraceae bacterium]
MRELGSARGEQVRCTDGTAGPNEFLVDVMWYNPDTHRPDAVFESEWKSIDEILYDFQKLLYLKCPLKVLICDPAPAHRPRLIPGLIELLKRYPDHVAGEQYVVINVKGSSFGGEADCYTWEVPRSAANPADIRFSMIEGSPFTYTLRERPASASVAGG